jgi:hypothetical protein
MNPLATEVSAWTAVLDELEASARSPEELVAWNPPEDLGPLPDALSPRAAAVLAALDAARAELGTVASSLLEELDALGGPAAPRMGPAFARRRRSTASDAPPSPRLVDHDA